MGRYALGEDRDRPLGELLQLRFRAFCEDRLVLANHIVKRQWRKALLCCVD